jgi:RNA polymerase sigma-70 factor (ECF subfamily)
VTELRGARNVAQGALMFSKLARFARVLLVNGAPGMVSFDAQGRPVSVLGFTVARGRIVEIDILADPLRLGQLNIATLNNERV